MSDTKRTLLFGGTFDPVHHGHLIVARAVAEQMGFDRVTLVPAGRSPHKGGAIASGDDRLEMLRLAIRGEELFDISETELRREGPSFTVDTLAEFGDRLAGELHWLVGADALDDLARWHNVRKVLKLAKIIIAVRNPWQEDMERKFSAIREALGDDAAAMLRNGVAVTPAIDISASQVRQRVCDGKSIRFLVPQAVADYIMVKRLYSPPTGTKNAAER
jgi:nicotinate-nucleotide adenylyltransferase